MRVFRITINVVLAICLVSMLIKLAPILLVARIIILILLGLAFLWSHKKRVGSIDWDIDDVKAIIAFVIAAAGVIRLCC